MHCFLHRSADAAYEKKEFGKENEIQKEKKMSSVRGSAARIHRFCEMKWENLFFARRQLPKRNGLSELFAFYKTKWLQKTHFGFFEASFFEKEVCRHKQWLKNIKTSCMWTLR